MAKRKKLKFTYEDIAKATGLSIGTIRNKASNKSFNPYSIVSVSKFVIGNMLLKPKQEKEGVDK